jgi:predicted enzyme related to lactoylglutathione lyase
MRLRSVMLYVKDLKRMTRFYADMLGTEPSNQTWTEAWANFDAGGIRFALHAVSTSIAENIQIASPPVPRENEPVKLIFEVADVESERQRLESLGIQTIRRPWQQPGEACDAVDPEGNIFQIHSSDAETMF